VAGVFGDGYVDRREGAESWEGEGKEMVMGAGEGRKAVVAKVNQTRQNKNGVACTCQGGGSGGGVGCGEGVVWVVVFFNVMAVFPHNVTFPCGMWHVAFQMMYTILNIV
jgi:hypothetical protein